MFSDCKRQNFAPIYKCRLPNNIVTLYFTLLFLVLVLLARDDIQKTLTGDDDKKSNYIKVMYDGIERVAHSGR